MGTAETQGKLWGIKARDWAQYGEPSSAILWQTVFRIAGLEARQLLLDIGCGAGGALAIAQDKCADLYGIDASAELVSIARQKLADARIEIADMEELPYPDRFFDLVTGFNSFQFAADWNKSLKEARRVLKYDGKIVVAVWGAKERCQTQESTGAVFKLLTPASESTKASLSDAGLLEMAMEQAGFRVISTGDIDCPFRYKSVDECCRAYLSAGPMAKLAESQGEDTVTDALRKSLHAYTLPDGSVEQRNEFHWVMGRKETTH